MKLGFQAWFLGKPYTGIGQHSLGLLAELLKRKTVELTVAVPEPLSFKRIPALKGIPRRFIHVLKPPWWLFHPALKKWYWERILVPQFFSSRKLDWEYYPYPSPLPPRANAFRAMTVHDLILWKDPRYQGNFLKTLYHRQARRSVVYVDQLFTVSKTTHEELGIPAATLLPNGAPPLPKKLPRLSYQDALVYLGGYDLRKNVPELVEVFSMLSTPLRLVLIGEAPYKSRYYPPIPKHKNVIRLGPLKDSQVYAVLKSSFAFLNFSDSEGFNVPLLQAMLLGTPAIVKDLPVNREISQNTALFLPHPSSKASLSQSLSDMIELLKNPAVRKRIVSAQKKAAQPYRWPHTARLFLKSLYGA